MAKATKQTEKVEEEGEFVELPPFPPFADDDGPPTISTELGMAGRVVNERLRQQLVLGYTADEDDKHDIGFFLQLLHGYEQQARVRQHYNTLDQTQQSVIKIAAVAVALAEKIDRMLEKGLV